jgi:site-specific recombinase XerD
MEHYMTSEKIEAYLKELSDEERAEATIEKYRRALLSFAAFLCGAAVTPETIKNWKDDLREKLRAVDDQHLSGRAERFLSLLWLDRLPRAVLKNSAPPVSRQQTGVNAHRI